MEYAFVISVSLHDLVLCIGDITTQFTEYSMKWYDISSEEHDIACSDNVLVSSGLNNLVSLHGDITNNYL
jgi:hypothetical protein